MRRLRHPPGCLALEGLAAVGIGQALAVGVPGGHVGAQCGLSGADRVVVVRPAGGGQPFLVGLHLLAIGAQLGAFGLGGGRVRAHGGPRAGRDRRGELGGGGRGGGREGESDEWRLHDACLSESGSGDFSAVCRARVRPCAGQAIGEPSSTPRQRDRGTPLAIIQRHRRAGSRVSSLFQVPVPPMAAHSDSRSPHAASVAASGLNNAQMEAVHHLDSPCLVLAGAGSGKTRVITYKIVRLLQHGLAPKNIAAITFTNKASQEMRERAKQLVGSKAAKDLAISTFHSLGVRMLREDGTRLGLKEQFSILDSDDVLGVLKDAGGATDNKLARQWQRTISLWKNLGVTSETAMSGA